MTSDLAHPLQHLGRPREICANKVSSRLGRVQTMTQLALATTAEMKSGGSPRRRTHRAGWPFVIALSIASLLMVEPLSAGAAGTWSATGTMSTARFIHTATLLPSG